MLPVLDTQVRLVLLSHVLATLVARPAGEVAQAGLNSDQLMRLRKLSAQDLGRMAAMRHVRIGVELDARSLNAALRSIALLHEVRALEDYFIRHGASCRLMRALFKIRQRVTLQRRIEMGVRRQGGRTPILDRVLGAAVYRTWRLTDGDTARARYYRLHQSFPDLSMAVLEATLRKLEVNE